MMFHGCIITDYDHAKLSPIIHVIGLRCIELSVFRLKLVVLKDFSYSQGFYVIV